MQTAFIRRSIVAALLAAAGSLALSCSLVEAQGNDLAVAAARDTQEPERRRKRGRKG